jgi:DNA integrity scanning protein DisA with diadenylate cyclase activity
MRDKNVYQLKSKHDFYIKPTYNASNLRSNTITGAHKFDDDMLSMYSGGGYIAKSRLGSNYSRRKKTAFGSKKSSNYRGKRVPKRFNEQLDDASQKSVNKRRAMSRGAINRVPSQTMSTYRPMTAKSSNVDKESLKNQILSQIEQMDKDELDKMSK